MYMRLNLFIKLFKFIHLINFIYIELSRTLNLFINI